MLALLASTHDWHHGWFFLWPLVPLFWLLVLLAAARFLFRRGRRGAWHAVPDPRAILGERYARGEIGVEEYRERLGNLER